MEQARNCFNFYQSECVCWKTKTYRITWISLTLIMLLHIVFSTGRELFQRKWGLTTSNWPSCSLMVLMWKNVSLLVTVHGAQSRMAWVQLQIFTASPGNQAKLREIRSKTGSVESSVYIMASGCLWFGTDYLVSVIDFSRFVCLPKLSTPFLLFNFNFYTPVKTGSGLWIWDKACVWSGTKGLSSQTQ